MTRQPIGQDDRVSNPNSGRRKQRSTPLISLCKQEEGPERKDPNERAKSEGLEREYRECSGDRGDEPFARRSKYCDDASQNGQPKLR
jgi:hypothetical protein